MRIRSIRKVVSGCWLLVAGCRLLVAGCWLPVAGCLLLVAVFSCNTNYTVGKKRGYFKIDFPEKKYQLFDQPGYPYRFEYPVYATVIKDTTFFEAEPENPWWINIEFPQFNGRTHISYKEVGKNNLESLINDAYHLSNKQHINIATGKSELEIITPHNIYGMYYILTGNTATADQFFLTDSTKHFLRGALYFAATPNEDSIRTVNEFLRQDLQHLINTLEWKD